MVADSQYNSVCSSGFWGIWVCGKGNRVGREIYPLGASVLLLPSLAANLIGLALAGAIFIRHFGLPKVRETIHGRSRE